VARAVYGLACSAVELPSERDRNFRLDCRDGRRFVLKVAAATVPPEALVAENAILAAAREAAGGVVPEVIAGDGGSSIHELRDGHEVIGRVRCLSWIDGVPMADVVPHRPELLREIGAALGTIDRALVGLELPGLGDGLEWNMKNAEDVVVRYRELVDDPEEGRLVDACLAGFREHAKPRLAELRQSVVYHDANDHNILVDDRPGRQGLAGLIDFGDASASYTIAEPAVACAYAMLGKRDPLAAARALLGGYHEGYAVPEHEIDVVFDLVRMRLCASVVMSARGRAANPDNDYLQVSVGAVSKLLGELEAVPREYVRARFREACGYEPCATNAVTVGWLQRQPRASVLDVDLDPVVVHDLGVGSLEIAGLAREWDARELGEMLERLRGAAGARVGVGRWNEARRLYTSDGFARETEDRAEPRTVHLGIDLFCDAGTGVVAPFHGIVHAVADDAGPLDYGPTVVLHHAPEPGVGFFTLYGHLDPRCLTELRPGQEVSAGHRIADIGRPERNGGWPPHLHFQVITDMLGREGEFPGVAAPSERAAWLSLCPDPNLVLGIAALEDAPESLNLGERRARCLGPSLSLSYARPLTIVEGRGQWLYDDCGRRYLDAVNNVPHVGHCHPRVVAAGQRQMAVLNTNTRYLHENVVRYAERLAATMPDPLEVCFFVCSGSEANELALRLARAHTGRRDWLVVDGAYHGNTQQLVELSSYKYKGRGGFAREPRVHEVPMPDVYRGLHAGCVDAAQRYAGDVADVLAGVDDGVAAFLAEPLLGCGGQIVPPDGWLSSAFAHVRASGGLCIADEVQVGFGRVGTHMWAFEADGAVPDIVTLGKPIGNGHPLGAVITTRAIAESFANGMEYFNTFGGNPVSCAIGLAVLDVLLDEGLMDNARTTGEVLLAGLRELQGRHALIGDIRGRGLFAGVELVTDRDTRTPAPAHARHVVERMKDRGVLISTDGPDANVLKIKPPLCFSEDDAGRLCATLDTVLGESALCR